MAGSAPPTTTPLDAAGLTVGLVRARFNDAITLRLLEGAWRALREADVQDGDVIIEEVPGAVELPLAADLLLTHRALDAVVCLGAVIEGETRHFDYVCDLASRGIQRVSLRRQVPIGFGVLTCRTAEQADERSGPGDDNAGVAAARAALELALLGRRLQAEADA